MTQVEQLPSLLIFKIFHDLFEHLQKLFLGGANLLFLLFDPLGDFIGVFFKAEQLVASHY
jgi:hypothetical protein